MIVFVSNLMTSSLASLYEKIMVRGLAEHSKGLGFAGEEVFDGLLDLAGCLCIVFI